MKKLIFVLLIAIQAVSCEKEEPCECKAVISKYSSSPFTIFEIDSEQAKEDCELFNGEFIYC